MRYNAFIFDFDYTLGDATAGVVEAANFALGRLGFPAASRDQIRRTVGLSLPETFTLLTGNAAAELRARFLDHFMERAEAVMTPSTELFADTVEVLSRLRAGGAALGIASTKYRRRLLQILEKFHIGHLFDVVVGGDDVRNPKPDPEALLKAVNSLGAVKREVVYVGDSIVDIITADSAGVDFIAVTTGATAKEAFLPYPHIAIIDSLSELLTVHPGKGPSG